MHANVQARKKRLSNESIRIGQINLARSRVATEEMGRYAVERGLDVLITQEPYTYKGKIQGLGTDARIAHAKHGTPWAAVAVYRNDYTVLQIEQATTTQTAAIRINTGKIDINIISMYSKVSKENPEDMRRTLRELDIAMIEADEHGFIVGIDANAKSAVWYSNKTDERGKKLEEYIAQNGLKVANQKQEYCTFDGPCGRSNIDITMTKKCKNLQITEWTIIDGATQSDHNLITFKIQTTREQGLGENQRDCHHPRYKMDNRKIKQLRCRVAIGLSTCNWEPNSIAEINEATDKITEVIITACDRTFEKVRNKRRIAAWWSDSLDKLKKNCYKSRKIYQKEKNESEKLRKKMLYRKARTEYTAAIIKAKNESWRCFVETKSREDMWKFMDIYNNRNMNVPIMTTSRMLGTKTWKEVADQFLKHYFPTDDVKDDTPMQTTIRQESTQKANSNPTRTIEEKEVEDYLLKLKKNVAPGIDRIENEVLKKIADLVAPGLTKIYRACMRQGFFPTTWKTARLKLILKEQTGNQSNPASYRPLSLLSNLGKTFEKIIRDRISEKIEISKHQYGFKRGLSTTDAVEHAINTVRKCNDKIAIMIFIDIKAAFDRVWWPHLLIRLRREKCPTDAMEVIRDYLRDRRVVLTEGAEAREITPEKGCPQGSVLGPTLWNVSFDELLRTLHSIEGATPVAYADDLMIIVSGNNKAELEGRAQGALRCTYLWCSRHKLEISDSKTKWLIVKGKITDDRLDIRTMKEQNIQKAEAVKYLGVWIDHNIKFHTHCQKVADKAKSTFQGYRKIARANWGIRHRQLTQLYKAIFIPKITYAAGAWGGYATLSDYKKLVTAQRAALITATRAYRTISTPALLVIANANPIQHDIQKERLRHSMKTVQKIRINEVMYDPDTEDNKTLIEKLERSQGTERQIDWENETRGRTTFEFFPNIEERKMASWIEANYYTTQYMSGHGNFRSKLRKFNLVKNNKCQCGQLDTPTHTFLECTKYKEQRKEYEMELQKAGISWPANWKQSVTEKIFTITTNFVTAVLKKKELCDKERRE